MWKLVINVEGGRKHLLPRGICGKKYKFGGVTVKHLQAKGTCVVQHPEFEGTGEG